MWTKLAVVLVAWCSVVLATHQCDMCTCHVLTTNNSTLLTINCSDTQRADGDNSIKEPSYDSYKKYHADRVWAFFERNGIVRVPEMSIGKLERLVLAENGLTTLNPTVFTAMNHLKQLSLSRNRIEALSSTMFRRLGDLQLLDLSGNLLVSLQSGAFKHLSSLQTLLLSNNRLRTLDSDIFSSLKNLRTLDLSNNFIEYINQSVFLDISALKYLSLAGNRIRNTEELKIESLKSLVELDLSRNGITHVAEDKFAYMANLRRLQLSNNNLTKPVKLSPSIRVVDISNNRFDTVDKMMTGLDELEELHASRNRITDLSHFRLDRLQVLNVSNNRLRSFPAHSMAHLRVLDLSYNMLTLTPSAITPTLLPALEELVLDGNPISELRFPTVLKEEGSFENLSSISACDMPLLEEVPNEAFTGVMAACTRCSEERGGAGELREAACERNSALRLARNPRLGRVHETAFRDVGLCELDLSDNALRTLPRTLLPWPQLRYLDLQRNPWHCGCELQWLLGSVVAKLYETAPTLLFELRCETPATVRGKRMVHFYNWTKHAFCNEFEQLRAAPSAPTSAQETVSLGSSSVLLAVILSLGALLLLLVGVGVWMQFRRDRHRRVRNRRL